MIWLRLLKSYSRSHQSVFCGGSSNTFLTYLAEGSGVEALQVRVGTLWSFLSPSTEVFQQRFNSQHALEVQDMLKLKSLPNITDDKICGRIDTQA